MSFPIDYEKAKMSFTGEELLVLRGAINARMVQDYQGGDDEYKVLEKLYDRVDKTLDVYFPDLRR